MPSSRSLRRVCFLWLSRAWAFRRSAHVIFLTALASNSSFDRSDDNPQERTNAANAVCNWHRDSASDLGITRFHTLATPNTAKNQGKTALCSIETELFDGLYGHLRN